MPFPTTPSCTILNGRRIFFHQCWNGAEMSQNLIVLNVNTQALLKLTTTNYSAWWLQFKSLLCGYDLLRFIDSLKSCPPAMITPPYASSPSSNMAQTGPVASQCNCWVCICHPSAVYLYFHHISCCMDYSRKDVCLSFAWMDHDPSSKSCQLAR